MRIRVDLEVPDWLTRKEAVDQIDAVMSAHWEDVEDDDREGRGFGND